MLSIRMAFWIRIRSRIRTLVVMKSAQKGQLCCILVFSKSAAPPKIKPFLLTAVVNKMYITFQRSWQTTRIRNGICFQIWRWVRISINLYGSETPAQASASPVNKLTILFKYLVKSIVFNWLRFTEFFKIKLVCCNFFIFIAVDWAGADKKEAAPKHWLWVSNL